MAYIKEFSGKIYFEITPYGIKKFAGLVDYKIDGRITKTELMFALTLLFEENY